MLLSITGSWLLRIPDCVSCRPQVPEVPQAPEAPQVPAAPVADPVAELKKYKELLDSGIISQEDFDAKKRQILGF